jgi:hypothetical protein
MVSSIRSPSAGGSQTGSARAAARLAAERLAISAKTAGLNLTGCIPAAQTALDPVPGGFKMTPITSKS